jgi:molybdopterin converting factor small subunit
VIAPGRKNAILAGDDGIRANLHAGPGRDHRARAFLGVAQAEFDCADGIDLGMFWNELTARFPELAPMRPTIRLARDGEFLDGSGHVQPGDEIALIPPVSGG